MMKPGTKEQLKIEYKANQKAGKLQDERDVLEEVRTAIGLISLMGVETFVYKNGTRRGVKSEIKILDDKINKLSKLIHIELDKLPKVKVVAHSYEIVD